MSNILIVDDNSDLRLFIDFALSAKGFKVYTEDSIPSAMYALEDFKPDVILLDLFFPDGLSILSLNEIHQKSPQSKIIIMTGWEKEEGLSLPEYVVGWLFKPFNIEQLLESINVQSNSIFSESS